MKDPRVDAYIGKSADFAKPILKELRAIVHEGCPEVEETLKWGSPHFMYHGMLAGMASFKAHCAFGFWRGREIVPDAAEKNAQGMGHLGRITSVDDLPPRRTTIGYVKKAMALNESGTKRPTKPRSKPAPLVVPSSFNTALRKNRKARATFDAFSASHRREYVQWIAEAKREETREKRIAQALEWLAEGKPRNWKYS
jgi:uncharacterized protein YdeI (YjbR/CyaY-like superfamily)